MGNIITYSLIITLFGHHYGPVMPAPSRSHSPARPLDQTFESHSFHSPSRPLDQTFDLGRASEAFGYAPRNGGTPLNAEQRFEVDFGVCMGEIEPLDRQ